MSTGYWRHQTIPIADSSGIVHLELPVPQVHMIYQFPQLAVSATRLSRLYAGMVCSDRIGNVGKHDNYKTHGFATMDRLIALSDCFGDCERRKFEGCRID
jgi:hypothetical protein